MMSNSQGNHDSEVSTLWELSIIVIDRMIVKQNMIALPVLPTLYALQYYVSNTMWILILQESTQNRAKCIELEHIIPCMLSIINLWVPMFCLIAPEIHIEGNGDDHCMVSTI